MEFFGMLGVLIIGSLAAFVVAFKLARRLKPSSEIDPFIDERYGRMKSEFSPSTDQPV